MPRSPIREITKIKLDSIKHHEIESGFPRLNGVNLDFPSENTQYATHALHPYVAAINPPLARTLLTHYGTSKNHILDPFCGGGGVLVECLLNGNRATGYDVNPLACHISSGKTTYVPTQVMVRELQKLLLIVKPDPNAPETVPSLVSFWYYEYILEWLVPLAKYVNSISEPKTRAVFQVALSATARDVMLTYRGEVRLRKLREQDQGRFKPVVIDTFKRRIELAIARVGSLPKNADVKVNFADCRELTKKRRFDMIITSPPYGDDKNGVGYFQFSRNMLYFLGYTLSEIKDARASFLGLGSEEIPGDWNPPSSLSIYLEHIENRSKRLYLEAIKFYYDYFCAFRSIVEMTRGRIVVVTGDRVLARTFIDNGQITLEILQSLGCPLEHYYSREIRKKRIANLGGDGGQISKEHILVHKCE